MGVDLDEMKKFHESADRIEVNFVNNSPLILTLGANREGFSFDLSKSWSGVGKEPSSPLKNNGGKTSMIGGGKLSGPAATSIARGRVELITLWMEEGNTYRNLRVGIKIHAGGQLIGIGSRPRYYAFVDTKAKDSPIDWGSSFTDEKIIPSAYKPGSNNLRFRCFVAPVSTHSTLSLNVRFDEKNDWG